MAPPEILPTVRELKSRSASILIYEDPFSRRVRVDDYEGDATSILKLINEATSAWTEKLIVKSRGGELDFFLHNGFSKEAFISKYFAGVDMHFVTMYFSADRKSNKKEQEEESILHKVLSGSRNRDLSDAPTILATPDDASDLARLYGESFKVYPTPMNDPDYIRKTMTDGTIYLIIRDGEGIASAASAEINARYVNAELTDCASAPRSQNKGHMKKLLADLAELLAGREVRCLYTIARAESFGMNNAFYQLGYTFGGRMTNNCMIFSGLEDMNVWYKS